MRILLFVAMVFCADYVVAENCTVNNDCNKPSGGTGCSTGWDVICQHHNPSLGIEIGEGVCTCAAGNTYCTERGNCTFLLSNDANCRRQDLHCYDNRCICNRLPIIG